MLGVQARGATAPGFAGNILIGRGQDYAWTRTSAGSDLIDTYVEERLRGLLLKRAGSRLRAGRAEHWRRPFFEALGLYRLRGTIQYPGVA